MTAAIEFSDFTFSYRGKVTALDKINLVIPQGSFAAVTGPSGAGKTTLCLTISGLAPHYFGGAVSGTAVIAGVNTLESRVSALAERVGTVLEDYESQLVTMTVEDEVAFSLENKGHDRAEIVRRTAEVLAMVGLAGKEKLETASLSGGQKQRLAIAAVLATRPEILVLDEPASALDPEGAEELYSLLAGLNLKYGMTIVVVEHDLSRILPYADQLVLLDRGRLQIAGRPGDVFAHMRQNRIYTEGIPALYELKLSLEAEGEAGFNDWVCAADAIDDIVKYLQAATENKGVYKSA